ncbi:MAG: Mov34/MPN/PAD-1 family protein [Candidatus Ranarchaeia archaeon]
MIDGSLITFSLTKSCIQDIRAAIRVVHPKETGGYLIGTLRQFHHAIPLPNTSNDPLNEYMTFWEEGFAISQLYSKWLDHRTRRSNGVSEVRAFWHTHPNSVKAIPSAHVENSQLTGDYGFIDRMNTMFGRHRIGLFLIVSYANLRGGMDFVLLNGLRKILPLRLPKPYNSTKPPR